MAEVLTQIAGLTKEVAVAYLIMYGAIEILKVVIYGLIGWQGLRALANFFKGIFDC